MAHIIDSQIVEGLLNANSLREGFTSQATAASTLALSATSTHNQHFTGTTAGQIVRFPDATTLLPGHIFSFLNASTVTVVIQYFGGTNPFNLFTSFKAEAILLDNSTSAGTWGISAVGVGTASGILNYKIVSSASFAPGTADVLITSMSVVPLPGTYAIWFSCSAQIVTNNTTTNIHIYNGATKVTDSIRTVQNSVATFNTILSTQTTATFNGTDACEAHTDRSGGTMSITGRSLILIRLGD
jgi:hypothetical protein